MSKADKSQQKRRLKNSQTRKGRRTDTQFIHTFTEWFDDHFDYSAPKQANRLMNRVPVQVRSGH